MRIRDGFPGQRLRVLPGAVAAAAARSGPTSRLLVTDAGYFPHAANHGRARTRGASGTIVIVSAAGRGWCRTPDDLHRVDAARALVIPAGVPHEYWADDDDPWTIWWMHARGTDAAEFERDLVRHAGPDGVAVVEVHDQVRLVADLERVVEALETDETYPSLLRCAGAAWSVLAQVGADAAAGSPLRGEPVRAAQEYLRTHLDSVVEVAALARRFGLSTSHFSARFRAATGGGVIEYVKRLRMARACELLITTQLPVADIARAVGYDDPFYFSRQFRSVHACSPTDFRRGAHDRDR
ncbi:helix-turn-helix domain-containing protein [Promicromonospora citrea]|uniref:AraC family transcriptional regulator n=1 Tax=Promicromonospora citrea TaxID=43677 RepID=A0A8H9L254_9MICO|nr:AraC family transcriptional regulator [Promicromonospora citrea]NNH54054.1 AraC family transcriptional regulator [Promicromonospora citrea]GGM17458.1 AraC family transcriptional regulator [Promicromonospora citrea]